MLIKTFKSINYVFAISSQKKEIYFWLFIRFVSAILPLVTIYQFSHIIKLVETHSDFRSLFTYLLLIFAVRLLDNLLRIRSTTSLDFYLSNLSFEIHKHFLNKFNPQNKEDRHASIQAIRNFSDATNVTLSVFKQPGIDSLVSVLIIPVALYLVDIRSFVLILSYIITYSVVNYYTAQRYRQLRDFQNTKTESYYAKLQDSNDIDLEQSTYTRHLHRLTNWNFIEWFFLQNTAVIFYSIFLLYEIYLIFSGTSNISDLVLVMGYVVQTQSVLNSFTDIVFGLGDMSVAFTHLAKNQSIAVIKPKDVI